MQRFLTDGRLIRQADGCPMGGPISIVLFNTICMKMEKSHVDDIYTKQIKNQSDKLFENLNNYDLNIKLTIEVNPSKVLDAEIMVKNGIIEISVVEKKS